jgi:hypothetical protein
MDGLAARTLGRRIKREMRRDIELSKGVQLNSLTIASEYRMLQILEKMVLVGICASG